MAAQQLRQLRQHWEPVSEESCEHCGGQRGAETDFEHRIGERVGGVSEETSVAMA